MKIYLHMNVPSAPVLKRKMTLQMEEGMAVTDALEAYCQAGGELSYRGGALGFTFLVNGARAGASQVLRDKDRLEVLRPMTRG